MRSRPMRWRPRSRPLAAVSADGDGSRRRQLQCGPDQITGMFELVTHRQHVDLLAPEPDGQVLAQTVGLVHGLVAEAVGLGRGAAQLSQAGPSERLFV